LSREEVEEENKGDYEKEVWLDNRDKDDGAWRGEAALVEKSTEKSVTPST
jgi:hypothetical protein